MGKNCTQERSRPAQAHPKATENRPTTASTPATRTPATTKPSEIRTPGVGQYIYIYIYINVYIYISYYMLITHEPGGKLWPGPSKNLTGSAIHIPTS